MNKQTIINEAKEEIKEHKLLCEIEAEQKYKEARAKSATFKKIDQEIREKTIELARFDESSKEAKKIRQELEDLKLKKTKELEKLNINLAPNYDCKKCGDEGYVDGVMCVCLKQKIQSKLLKFCGIPTEKLHTFNDSNNAVLDKNPMLKKAYELAHNYTEKFPNIKTQNLIFMGDVGVGKTFLLECIASKLMQKNFFVVYTTAFSIANSLLKALTLPASECSAIMSTFLECDLLIIDDLGTENFMRNITVTNFFNILNEREIKGKATLISTNLGFDDIEKRYGNRVFSRMFNKRKAKVISFAGCDLRIN